MDFILFWVKLKEKISILKQVNAPNSSIIWWYIPLHGRPTWGKRWALFSPGSPQSCSTWLSAAGSPTTSDVNHPLIAKGWKRKSSRALIPENRKSPASVCVSLSVIREEIHQTSGRYEFYPRCKPKYSRSVQKLPDNMYMPKQQPLIKGSKFTDLFWVLVKRILGVGL